MTETNRRGHPATGWILATLVAVLLFGVAFMLLAPTETADDAREGITQQDSPKVTPADRPRDKADKGDL